MKDNTEIEGCGDQLFPVTGDRSAADRGQLTDLAEIATMLEQEDHALGSQIVKHECTPVEAIQNDKGTRPENDLLATVSGIDVSRYQGKVNWKYWRDQGIRFAYVKATEGISYRNPYFAQQYSGSYRVGMTRGAYHFALPNVSSGAVQANFFVDHGGGWSPDGKTLPGALDIEYNPYAGGTCYGLRQSATVSWIRSFRDAYRSRTGRSPTIYTSTPWWLRCTGNRADFSSTSPLWVARYASAPDPLPYNWHLYTFWLYTSSPIDRNLFNGSYERLWALATG